MNTKEDAKYKSLADLCDDIVGDYPYTSERVDMDRINIMELAKVYARQVAEQLKDCILENYISCTNDPFGHCRDDIRAINIEEFISQDEYGY